MSFMQKLKAMVLPAPKKRILVGPSGKEVPLARCKWVVTPDGVGIITHVDGAEVYVDIVNEDGTTSHSVTSTHKDIRLAGVEDIPENRRPVDDTSARHLGYL